MDVQKRVRDLMKLRGWTDYRLAKEASLSHSTVTNMFNRNNAPTLPTLEAVCRAFGITLAQFFADEVDPAQLTDEQRTLLRDGVLLPSGRRIFCSTSWKQCETRRFYLSRIDGFLLRTHSITKPLIF